MSAAQETTLTIQSDDDQAKTTTTTDTNKEIDSRTKSNSFIEIIRRTSRSFTHPILIECENSKDEEKDSPSKSTPETKEDLSDENKAISKSRVWLRYVTLLTLCFDQMISAGICYSLGVLYVSFRTEFETSKATTALIISICLGIFGFGGVFSGMLVNCIGVRWSVIIGSLLCFLGNFSSAFVANIWYLLITLGILLGTGSAIINVATMVSVSKIFKKNKDLMSMLLTISAPVGTFCMPQLMNLLLDIYGWRGTLIILSGLALNMCFAGILSTYSEQPTTEIKARPKLCQTSILRNKIFLAVLLASSVCSSCVLVLSVLVVDFWKERGNSMWQSVTILTINSISGIASRFFFGISHSIHDLSKHYFIIFYCSIMLGGLSNALIPQCTNFLELTAVVLLSGFAHGIVSTVRVVIVLRTVDLTSYSVAFGLLYTGLGIGTLTSTSIAGKISDLTHSYDVSFYSAGITESAVAFVLFITHLCLERNQKQ